MTRDDPGIYLSWLALIAGGYNGIQCSILAMSCAFASSYCSLGPDQAAGQRVSDTYLGNNIHAGERGTADYARDARGGQARIVYPEMMNFLDFTGRVTKVRFDIEI